MKRFLGTYLAALLVLVVLVTSPLWWPLAGGEPAGEPHLVLGTSRAVAALVLAIAAVLALLPALVVRRLVSVRPPRFPLTYSPPAGMGPAQAAALLPGASPVAAFRAAVLHARNHGLVRLERVDGVLTLREGQQIPDLDEDLDDATRKVSLLVTAGEATRLDETSSLRVSLVRGQVLGAARQWVHDQGLLTAAPIRPRHVKARAVLVSACPLLVMLLVPFAPTIPTMWILLPGVLTAAGIATLAMEAGRKLVATVGITVVALVPYLTVLLAVEDRTFVALPALVSIILLFASGMVHKDLGFEGRVFLVPSAAGRQLWSELGGFRRALATEGSRDRFDFAGRNDLFLTYLPWAVLFGIEEVWARNLEVEYRDEDHPLFFFEPGIEAWGNGPEVGLST